VAWQFALGAPPPTVTQQTSPVGQLSELVQLRDTPGHCPIGAHVALPPPPPGPPPPPPPNSMQHSSLVGSQLVMPHAIGVSGMPLSPMVPPSTPEPPSVTVPPSLPVLPSVPEEPPSREPPLLEPPEPPPDPLLELPPLLDLPPSSPDRPLRSSSRTVRPPQPAMTTIAMSAPAYLMVVPLLFPAKESLPVPAEPRSASNRHRVPNAIEVPGFAHKHGGQLPQP
jgi:formin 2